MAAALKILSDNAARVDGLIADIAGNSAAKVAIVAMGGYGRSELAPLSDIDLLFLCDEAPDASARKFIETVQQQCWSAGLKPACSARSLKDCEEAMAADVHFLTSLLERRLIWGDKKIFAKLDKAFQHHLESRPPEDFIAAKLTERDVRHKKMGDTRFQLQPNVKEGKGALRDIQTLFWISRFLQGTETPAFLTAEEKKTLHDAYAFFSAVRCHLHEVANGDRMSFEAQPEVASRMGYADAEPNLRAEKFMKDYFLMTNEVGHLTRILCAALEAEALKGTKKMALHDVVDGFEVRHARLTAAGFEAPSDIIRLFRASQVSGFDIHPDALRLMRTAKDALHGDKDAHKIFLDILLDKKNAEQTLRRMNEAGLLAALIPAFGAIVAHMQYDMYHAYTADEHTLRAAGMMHKIENGELAADAPLATDLFGKIRSRRALYAAMFLHDIAKGTGGKHSEKGADVARTACPALGLAPEETETVSWLVENHLLMTFTAYKRDLNDPKTLHDFVGAVQSPERLKLLTILTTADIMAVGPGKWNNWKSGLLSELYRKAADAMAGLHAPESIETFVAAQRKVRRLVGRNTVTLNTLIDHAPGYFWAEFPPESVATFVEAIDKAVPAIRITPQPAEDHTEVFVYAPDRKGLFSILSGAMAASGASIVDARIFTLGNGMALDVFHVQDVGGHVYDNAAFLQKTLKAALNGTLDLTAEIAARQKTRPKKSTLFPVQPRVIIDNNASAGSTVIEINARDRTGLLHDITSALTAEGLQISAAKIATFGARAVDVFYVKDGFGLKVMHNEKLAHIEKNLLKALS